MKALKIALVVSAVILLYVACGENAVVQNGNSGRSAQPANANTTQAPAAAAPTNANTGAAVTSPANSNASAASGSPQQLQAAADLYAANNCALCHGENGKGKFKGAPDFTDAAWQKTHTDAELMNDIKNGEKAMPAYKDKLNDEQIKSLVAYVRSFAKK
jgi:cytochrome c6